MDWKHNSNRCLFLCTDALDHNVHFREVGQEEMGRAVSPISPSYLGSDKLGAAPIGQKTKEKAKGKEKGAGTAAAAGGGGGGGGGGGHMLGDETILKMMLGPTTPSSKSGKSGKAK